MIAPWAVGYLKGLEDRARGSLADAVVAMYHGSPRDDDEYVFPWAAHEELLALARADIVLLGHTHLPFVFRSGARLVANPGSVGQPRDGDPRASWGLLDTARRTFELRRVAYVIAAMLVQVGIFSTRWNVVIGGQLFSKSLRGLTVYKVEIGGAEGVLVGLAGV